MLVAVIALYVVLARATGTRHLPVHRAGQVAHPGPDHAEVAVPRLLHRVRDQGAAVAVPHLAARRRRAGAGRAPPCCWSACWTRSARSACSASAWSCSPTRRKYFTPLVIALAVIGIMYGAIVAIGQTDIKRLIAYTSISHFGFIALGVFAMTSQGAVRRDALHGQPRLLHRRAVPDRRLPDRPARLAARSPTTAACRRSRRCWPACSWSPAWPACRCRACPPSSASSWC